MHTVVGAGATSGSMDASNLLKPALARGQLRCIGATTIDEYRKYIEKDKVSLLKQHVIYNVIHSLMHFVCYHQIQGFGKTFSTGLHWRTLSRGHCEYFARTQTQVRGASWSANQGRGTFGCC